jgi:hypothetical protein
MNDHAVGVIRIDIPDGTYAAIVVNRTLDKSSIRLSIKPEGGEY